MKGSYLIPFTTETLTKFIELYRSQQCLWNRAHAEYKNKKSKSEALKRLTNMIREFFPEATKMHTMKKIESFRSCYRRERKKVTLSRRYPSVERYKPQLWYYSLLSFLDTNEQNYEHHDERYEEDTEAQDQEDDDDDDESSNPPSLSGTIYKIEPTDSQPISIIVENKEYDVPEFSESYTTNEAIVNREPRAKSSKSTYNRSTVEESKDPLINSNERKRPWTEIHDEYDAVGYNVAAKLRSLPLDMKIIAEKLINNVLFEAQIGNLTNSSTISIKDNV